ncbi:MAG: phosphoserine phosphatase SerB [Arthrobacter sp.]|uniref:phosphoserine phosphatase SerB n=1 Tax=Arthrobacter sp. TaxID=1667 RepID=UPI00346D7414
MQTTAYVVHYFPAGPDGAPAAEPPALLEAIAAAGFAVASRETFSGDGYGGARLSVRPAEARAVTAAQPHASFAGPSFAGASPAAGTGADAPHGGGSSAPARAGGGLAGLRAAVLNVDGVFGAGTGACVVPADLFHAPRMLLVLDVDSTLIRQEVVELLAAHAGPEAEAEVTEVTEAAMRGELDFAQSLHARVATLAGLEQGVMAAVRDAVELTPGASELVEAFHAAGHAVGVVSGGFIQILAPLAAELGLDFADANELGVEGGRLTGTVVGDVVDRAAKEARLREWALSLGIPLAHTIAVGDGANDLDMVRAAGLGVAFNAQPALREGADAAIDLPRLDVVRHLVGI